MGSLYRRGQTWWIKYSVNGRPTRESSGSKVRKVAETMLRIREGDIAQGKVPGVNFSKVTFEELAADIKRDYELNRKRSLYSIERAIKLHLRPFFGYLLVPQITSTKIAEFISFRKEQGASNATVNRELACLKRMMNLGAKQTPPKVDRVPHFPMLRENNTRKGFFEAAEFAQFREALPEYLRGFVTFAYKTGCRKGEISNLTWDRIDREKGVVRLEAGETKSGQGRTFFLDEELKGIISKLFAGRQLGCPYVFSHNGHPIGDIRKSWRNALKETGISEKLFHDLRRTAVRNMVRAGIPERVSMMISGHKTRSVFDRYNIVSDEDLRVAAARQEEYLRKAR